MLKPCQGSTYTVLAWTGAEDPKVMLPHGWDLQAGHDVPREPPVPLLAWGSVQAGIGTGSRAVDPRGLLTSDRGHLKSRGCHKAWAGALVISGL